MTARSGDRAGDRPGSRPADRAADHPGDRVRVTTFVAVSPADAFEVFTTAVRHGKDVPAFLRDLGMWWGALMSSLREHASAPGAV